MAPTLGDDDKEIILKILASCIGPIGSQDQTGPMMDMVKVPVAWILSLEKYAEQNFHIDRRPPSVLDLKPQGSVALLSHFHKMLALLKFALLKCEIDSCTLEPHSTDSLGH